MEEIYQNLQNPAWWFTGLFFAALIYLIKTIGQSIPIYLQDFSRKFKYRQLVYVRNNRTNSTAIAYQISSAQSYFMVFMFICGSYLFWYTSSSMSVMVTKHPLFAFILSLPIYISELLWLYKDIRCQKLVKEHDKILKYAHKRREPAAHKRVVMYDDKPNQ